MLDREASNGKNYQKYLLSKTKREDIEVSQNKNYTCIKTRSEEPTPLYLYDGY